MAYQVLARKWRPSNFEQVVGQQHVLKALSNALKTDRLHHAYLFTGTRGVGKTTIARIFAKCLNCEQGVTATPCGTCSACMGISEGRFVDLIEVDAASRTKVEDTRELLENVQYAPTQGRYKVYLIDEVHMLSGHSFNALLKTLEEPPPHVKFLLATTDPQRLPITVLSRCLQFHLKAMPPEKIVDYLKAQLDQEQIAYETPALAAIARAAEGSMRDALSLLDQAIAFTDGQVKSAEVHQMLGTIEQDYLYRLLEALAADNGPGVLKITAELSDLAVNFGSVLADFISLLHRLALLKAVPDSIPEEEEHARLRSVAPLLSAADVQLYYQLALIGRRDLPIVPQAREGFEMIMLRLLAFRPLKEVAVEVRATTRPAGTEQIKPTVTESAPAATNINWHELVPKLNLTGPVQSLAAQSALKSFENNVLCLDLEPKQAAFLTERLQQRLQEALSQYFQKTIKLIIEIIKPTVETPAAAGQRQGQEKHSAALQDMQTDPNVLALGELFGTKIDPNLVKVLD